LIFGQDWGLWLFYIIAEINRSSGSPTNRQATQVLSSVRGS
jgi:hypothetical protein